jgi:hypothetical protein
MNGKLTDTSTNTNRSTPIDEVEEGTESKKERGRKKGEGRVVSLQTSFLSSISFFHFLTNEKTIQNGKNDRDY